MSEQTPASPELEPGIRAIYAPRGKHSHWLNERTDRTLCGIAAGYWDFNGPGEGEAVSCTRCSIAAFMLAARSTPSGEALNVEG